MTLADEKRLAEMLVVMTLAEMPVEIQGTTTEHH
jgi:hypothetical protein